jgi:hypothetical protein
MRTALFLLAGLLLLAACSVLARLFSAQYPGAPIAAFIGYVVVWFLVAAFNMWVGVANAGYATTEELPIFLLIFGIPVLIAAVIKWKVL